MLKRIAAVAAASVLILSLAACAGVNTAPVPNLATEAEFKTVNNASYDRDLKGLCKYMEDAGVVAKNESDPVEMSYATIGAIGGLRYRFSYNNSTVQVEFYEYAEGSADANLDEAKETGRITVLDREIPVTVSGDGRFLMIYTDAKAGDKEENAALQTKVKELFEKF